MPGAGEGGRHHAGRAHLQLQKRDVEEPVQVLEAEAVLHGGLSVAEVGGPRGPVCQKRGDAEVSAAAPRRHLRGQRPLAGPSLPLQATGPHQPATSCFCPVPCPGLGDGGRPRSPGTWACMVPGSQLPSSSPAVPFRGPSCGRSLPSPQGAWSWPSQAPWVSPARLPAGSRGWGWAGPGRGGRPPVQVVDEVAHVVGQDDAVLAHVAVVAQHAHGHVRGHLGKLPQDVVEGPGRRVWGEMRLSCSRDPPPAPPPGESVGTSEDPPGAHPARPLASPASPPSCPYVLSLPGSTVLQGTWALHAAGTKALTAFPKRRAVK